MCQDSMRGYQRRLSRQLIRDHQAICIEDTAIRKMSVEIAGLVTLQIDINWKQSRAADPRTIRSPHVVHRCRCTGGSSARTEIPSGATYSEMPPAVVLT